MKLSRSLITFAFVAEQFNQHQDIASGFGPLFSPVLHRHVGEKYDPEVFAKEFSETYGIAMHPYVATDLAPKMAKLGLLHPITAGKEIAGYVILDKGLGYPPVKEEQIGTLVEKFFAFAKTKTEAIGVTFTDEELESALYRRLITMEFLAIANRNQPSYVKSTTLTLGKQAPIAEDASEADKREARLDFLCADFVETIFRSDPESFELLSDVSCGALLAEVVIGLGSPPAAGQDGSELTMYLDAPFIMDLLGLADPTAQKYAELLLDSAKASKAAIACFTHNIEEIEVNIDAPIENLKNHAEVFGPTGRLLLKGGPDRAYVLSIRKDVTYAVERLGIKVVDIDSPEFAGNSKFYNNFQEQALANHLGVYQNVYAKLRDAASIANIVRLRGERPMRASLFGCVAVFITRNPRLSNKAISYLEREKRASPNSFPPVITDRFLAGILWIAQGGKGVDVPRRKLLANCTSAMAPRRDVVSKMQSFLNQVDPKKAEHFEALIANDRCAYYLMEQTLGDRDLLTLENHGTVYANVERATAERIIEEKRTEIDLLSKKHADEIAAVSLEKDQRISEGLTQIDDLNQKHADELAAVHLEKDQRISEGLTRIDDLKKQIDDLKVSGETQTAVLSRILGSERRRRTQLLKKCLGAGKIAERRAVFCVAGVFSVVAVLLLPFVGRIAAAFSIPLLDKILYAVVAALFAITISFVTFWRVPEYLFGNWLRKRRERVFFKKADELDLILNAETIEIDWEKEAVLIGGTDDGQEVIRLEDKHQP